jgi:hypothetical protein
MTSSARCGSCGPPRTGDPAGGLDLLREVCGCDPSAVSAEARTCLNDFAGRPERVIRSGMYDEIIREDEALRVALGDLLGDLDGPGGHRG